MLAGILKDFVGMKNFVDPRIFLILQKSTLANIVQVDFLGQRYVCYVDFIDYGGQLDT
jgi:hypothetical protein